MFCFVFFFKKKKKVPMLTIVYKNKLGLSWKKEREDPRSPAR